MANKVRQSVSAKMRSIQNKSTVDVNLKSSEAAIPTDQQARLSQTIQTHNAVSVPLSNSSNSTWIDCDGFDKIAITFKNDAATSSSVNVRWSNDGTTINGEDISVVASSTVAIKDGITDIKARYAQITALNGDAALAHTMSAWVYLKV